MMTDAAVCALFARTRWRMLRGVLRSSGSQKAAVVIGMIASAIAGIAGGIAAVAIGRTSDDLDAAYVTLTTGVVLIVVMVGVIAGVTQPVDPRVLATEPLGQRQLGLGLLAASAAGPPGLSALLVAIGLFAGAVRGWFSIVPIAFAVLAFLATLLLVSRATINLLGLLAARHPRVGQIVIGLSSLAFYAAFQVIPRDARSRMANLLAVTPMGQIGRGLAAAGTEPAIALVHVAIGSVWLVPLLWLFTWTTRRLITSVKGGTTTRSEVRDRRRPVRSLARRLCGNGAVGAVAWRGVLTRFRTPRTALETFTGAGVGLAIVLVPVLTGRQAGAGAVLVDGADFEGDVIAVGGDHSTGAPPHRSIDDVRNTGSSRPLLPSRDATGRTAGVTRRPREASWQTDPMQETDAQLATRLATETGRLLLEAREASGHATRAIRSTAAEAVWTTARAARSTPPSVTSRPPTSAGRPQARCPANRSR